MRPPVTRVTANGIEHGVIKSFPNDDRTDGFQHMKPEVKEQCMKKQKNDSTMVKARYKNDEAGGYLEMPFTLGAGHRIDYYRFIDEYVYDVPRGLVNQVNGTDFVRRDLEEGNHEIKTNLFSTETVPMSEKVVGKRAQHRFYSAEGF